MSLSRQQRRAAERQAVKLARKEMSAAAPSSAASISEAQLAANRANAQLSTGPVTEEGRAKSSQNSFKHGLYSKQLIIPGENAAALDALKADLRAEHQPGTETEAILVNEMAEHYWRIKRARRLEAVLMQGEFAITHLNAVVRVMTTAERGFHKALKTVRELQKQRGFVPQTADNGFVSQEREKVAPSATAGSRGFVSQNDDNVSPEAVRSAPANGFDPQTHNSKPEVVRSAPARSDFQTEMAELEAEFEAMEKLLRAA